MLKEGGADEEIGGCPERIRGADRVLGAIAVGVDHALLLILALPDGRGGKILFPPFHGECPHLDRNTLGAKARVSKDTQPGCKRLVDLRQHGVEFPLAGFVVEGRQAFFRGDDVEYEFVYRVVDIATQTVHQEGRPAPHHLRPFRQFSHHAEH